MLRKVKSKETLLKLFEEEGYAIGNYEPTDYSIIRDRKELIFVPEMFEFCGKELEFRVTCVDGYDLLHERYYWIEEWLEPISKGVM